MKKARYTSVLFILILLSALIQLPQGQAIVPDSQTISIIDTHDDKFITEAGVGIDAWLCHILDPTMDIISYLVFRGVEVNNWEPLTNATLRFRTTVNQDFDAESSVTIYGMKYSELQKISIIRPSFVLSVPLTSAHVNVNTSQFYGQQWHEVNVTNIVEELIRSYDWDGDGHAGTETGDAIGFVIFGAEGYDTRWFIDYHYGTPSLASQLVIHWNHEVPPPIDYEDAEFVEVYGDNYTIWNLTSVDYPVFDPGDYVFTNGTSEPYDIMYDYIGNDGDPVSIAQSERDPPTSYSGQRKIVRSNDGTLYAVYDREEVAPGLVYVKNSTDNGETWLDEILISTVTDYSQKRPSIAIDSENNLHVVSLGAHDSFPGVYQVWYTKFNGSWQDQMRISNYTGMIDWGQDFPSIAVDSNDNLYVTWSGGDTEFGTHFQIWVTNFTTYWGDVTRISTDALMDDTLQAECSIAIDSDDILHVIWRGISPSLIWHSEFDISWSEPEYLVGYTGHSSTSPSIAISPDDHLQVTYSAKTDTHPVNRQIFYQEHTDSWSSPVRISNYTGMSSYDQWFSSIAVDADNNTHVVWHGKATGYTIYDVVWYNVYTDSWINPSVLQPTGRNRNPILRWARWPAEAETIFFITDKNGTVIMDNGNTINSTDIQDIYDWIDREDPRPTDPDPPGWPETGYFTRFKIRLYYLAIGFGCLFGPILFFAWRRPSGYYLLCGTILMLMGIGMLLSIGQV